jgi:hypothetical protein
MVSGRLAHAGCLARRAICSCSGSTDAYRHSTAYRCARSTADERLERTERLSTAKEPMAQSERLPTAEEHMERYKTFAATAEELVGRPGAPESANQRVGSLIAAAVIAGPEQRIVPQPERARKTEASESRSD